MHLRCPPARGRMSPWLDPPPLVWPHQGAVLGLVPNPGATSPAATRAAAASSASSAAPRVVSRHQPLLLLAAVAAAAAAAPPASATGALPAEAGGMQGRSEGRDAGLGRCPPTFAQLHLQ